MRALGFIDPDDQLTIKGRLLRSIFHPAGITIVELMMSGALDELSANELAEVCSWFTFDNDRRLNNRNVVHARLVKVRRELWQIAQRVRGIEERADINPTPGIVPEFHGIALAWSRGTSLNGLLRRIDLAEGDILMILNQTIDLLHQLQSAIGQVVDAKDIWEQPVPVMTEGTPGERSASYQANKRIEQLNVQREHMERLRPLLGQASASLRHGIIVQSRTVPSMVASIGDVIVPLDAEEDRDAQGLNDPSAFVGDV